MKISCAAPIGLIVPKFVTESIMLSHPDKVGVIDQGKAFTYRQTLERVYRLSHGLLDIGIKKGDHIAVLIPSTHENLEAHYAVMGLGCPIVAINTRLSSEEVSYIINHSESVGLIVDWEYTHLITPIIEDLKNIKCIIITSGGKKTSELKGLDYEDLLAESFPEPVDLTTIEDENSLASIMYTSGTTARPKGVMLSYRNCWMRMMQHLEFVRPTVNDVYLHIVPMFHAQGWGGIWSIPKVGAVNVCTRYTTPDFLLKQVRDNKVTCACSAPAVFNNMKLHPDWEKTEWPVDSRVIFAGAPLPVSVVKSLEEKGIKVYQDLGTTEGLMSNSTSPTNYLKEWDDLPVDDRAEIIVKQGLPNFFAVTKVVREDGSEVEHNGEEMGEVITKGDTVMAGYWKQPEETAKVCIDGWFHTGDSGVLHPDGRLELRGRLKDMIISGGENISAVEPERVIGAHPDVAEVAVIGVPHEKWGETPKAIVVLKRGCSATEKEIIDFCRERLAHFKCPTSIEFVDGIPRTATGKIRKNILREPYWKGRAIPH
jgi:fatty-acyl-CoA synthase